MLESTRSPRTLRGLLAVDGSAYGVAVGTVATTLTGILLACVVALVARVAVPDGARAPARAGDAAPRAAQSPTLDVDPALVLEAVGVLDADLDDDAREIVRYCFTLPVREAGPASALRLVGPDVDAVATAELVRLAPDDRRCLLAGFPAGTAVRQFTLAVADTRAARDLDRVAAASTVAVTGTAATPVSNGATTAPDLRAVELLPALDRARYVFDEPLDEGRPTAPASFAYLTPDGRRHPAARVLSVEDATVIVSFDPRGADVRTARRFSVLDGAVADVSGAPSTAGTHLTGAGATAAPDLIDVRRLEGSDVQWEFTFDDPVEDAAAHRFVLYRDDGVASAGAAVSRPAPHVVRVVVPGTDEAADQYVRAAALPGAVRALGPGATASSLGTRAVGSVAVGPGATTGPDLVLACVEEASGQLVLWFDEVLAATGGRAEAAVLLLGPDGARSASALVERNGVRAVLQFRPSEAGASARALVLRGGFRDTSGEQSPTGSRPVHQPCPGR